MKKTALKRQSKKRAKESKDYKILATAFLARNPFCQMPSAEGEINCGREATQVHHMKGRSGKLFLDTRYWLAVCQQCHDYIHTHGLEAKKRKVWNGKN